MREEERILKAYEARRVRQLASPGFFRYRSLAHVYHVQERHRETMRLLYARGFHPLADVRILDVGCGDGNMLRQYVRWGASLKNVAGIELRPEPVEYAHFLNPNLDIRCGSAGQLPWPDASFDLVCQHTVFTSVLDPAMKQQIAREMKRVLRPKGGVFWYDFAYNNPKNPDVQGVKAGEIRALFPGFEVYVRRITLAPPITRCIPEMLLPVVYPLLSSLVVLRTHYLGLLIKPS